MTLLPLTRLTVLGAFLFIPGAYFAARFSSGFVRMVYRKFRRGRAYLKGSANDYFWFAVVSTVGALSGAALLAGSSLQSGLQPFEGTREVGTILAESPEPGRIRLVLELGGTHPGPGRVEVDLPGLRWALEGEFLRWRGAPRWVGFTDGHRVAAALGCSRDSGPPDGPADARTGVAGAYAAWRLAHRHPRWVPPVETALRRTPWLPADGGIYTLLVTEAGYVLVKMEAPKNGNPDVKSEETQSGGR